MLGTLKLLLPVLIPSWRFFDGIAPSPRIEYARLGGENETPQAWQEFRPRPDYLSIAQMLKRMIWNPRWNETLFVVSCAERLIDFPTPHSAQEIFTRLGREIEPTPDKPYLQFRLVFVHRENDALVKNVMYLSEVRRMEDVI